MKFQNPSLIFFERTDGRTNERTNGRTSRIQYAPKFFKVGGIKMGPGSLYIVYLFQHHLKFTSGLGNEENSLSDKQSCNNF